MPDYSCYITLKNTLDVALTKIGDGTGHGYWQTHPPDSIAAGAASTQFQTKDHVGTEGSDGWVTYRVELQDVPDQGSRPVVKVTFGDPTGNTDNWYGCSCQNGMGNALFSFSNTDYPKRDHPLTVTGTIGYNKTITTISAVANLKMPSPILNLYNSNGENRKVANQVIWDSATPNANDDNITAGVSGSYSPVTVDLAVATTYLNVSININNDFVGVPFYVQADIGTDENVLSNPNPQYFTTAGTQIIRASIQPSWQSTTFPWGMTGDAIWKLSVGPTRQSIPITTTRIEIYGLTKTLPGFYGNKIGVGFLRAMILPARNSGTMDWVQYVINAAFGTYGTTHFEYDTVDGAPHFNVGYGGGNFDLRSWITSSLISKSLVNCYDQAGIVQICLGLVVNVTSTWQYQKPFGYIMQTNLIGVGQCNNPFFQSNGTPPVIGNNDAKRTGFGNHAFVSIGSRANQIGDACGGPHQGTETLAQYIAASIQQSGNGADETTLYNSTGTKPGTAADVNAQAGVTSINGGTPTMTALTKVKAEDRTSRVMETATMVQDASSPFTNLDLSAIHEILVNKSGFKLLDHYQEVSAGGSEIRWVLDSDSGPTTINVAILSTPEHARLYFEDHLSKYQRHLEEVFTAPPAGMEKGQLCLTSPAGRTNHALMVWVRGNVFAHVSTATSLDVLESSFGNPLDQFMRSCSCEESDLVKPVLRTLQGPTRAVKVGQVFMVSPS
ncbi:hypothetical protein MMC18_004028, partial [Xylographa bjoerkii]|nr:hypothetical protein [Xylographa bjoerkii]